MTYATPGRRGTSWGNAVGSAATTGRLEGYADGLPLCSHGREPHRPLRRKRPPLCHKTGHSSLNVPRGTSFGKILTREGPLVRSQYRPPIPTVDQVVTEMRIC